MIESIREVTAVLVAILALLVAFFAVCGAVWLLCWSIRSLVNYALQTFYGTPRALYRWAAMGQDDKKCWKEVARLREENDALRAEQYDSWRLPGDESAQAQERA